MRLLTCIAALAAALMAPAQTATANDYPNRTVRIIVPYQAGQGTDLATRFLADHLARELGQNFIVDNKAGAGGNIGTAEAAHSPADGYTLLMGTNGTHVLNQFMFPKMSFDPEKDFEPIMLVSTFPMVLLTNPSSPYKNVADLLAAAKARPGSIDAGLPSTTALLVLELLKEQGETDIRGVRYKGSSSSMTDLIGGQVPIAIDTISAARSYIASGRLAPLGVTAPKATELLPGVRTVAEQGVPGFQVLAWNGLYAPRGTPAQAVSKLNAALDKILAQPEVHQRLLELGHEPAGGTPERLADFASSERKKWGPLIAKAGIRVD